MKRKIMSFILVLSMLNVSPVSLIYVNANSIESQKIEIDESRIKIKAGKNLNLKVKFTPENTTNKNVVWSTSDKSIATVTSSGSVKGISSGVATITVKTKDGSKEASCIVEVDFVSVEEVKINEDSRDVILDIGKNKTLKATVLPIDASNTKITWTSSDPSIATVSTSGSVKALKDGNVTITAKSVDGEKTDTANVSIGYIPVTGIEFDSDMIESNVDIGKTKALKAKIIPDNASIKTINWTSSDPTIATISKTGSVKGIKQGVVTITATTEDGNKVATSTVNVGYTTVSEIRFSNATNNMILNAGEKGLTIKADIVPQTSTNKKLIWTSSDTSIAFVTSAGKVVGYRDGDVTITATAEDGSVSASIVIKIVFIKVQGLSIDNENSTVTLSVNNEMKVNGYITPNDASNKYGLWTISDPTIASLKYSGKKDGPIIIKGLKEGTATITAVTEDGGFSKSFTLNVVYIKPENILFEQENNEIKLDSGKTISLKAKVIPEDSSEKNVIWTSSDPTIATVSKTGSVKGISQGKVTITASTESGNITKSCTIDVVYVDLENMKIEKK